MITTKLTGDKELQNLLLQLPRRVSSKGNRAAVTAAARPITRAMKATAPRESGLLRRSIGTKIKTYKSTGRGTPAVAVIGARRAVQGTYKGRNRVPANYIHLVAGGTSHSRANDFVQRSFRSNKANAIRIAGEKFREVVIKEAVKLGKR